MQVTWTLRSLEKIEGIQDYIGRDSEFYAFKFTDKIFETAKVLANNPNIGRVVPEFKKENIRELILGNFRIIYRVDNEYAMILTVSHVKQTLTWKDLK